MAMVLPIAVEADVSIRRKTMAVQFTLAPQCVPPSSGSRGMGCRRRPKINLYYNGDSISRILFLRKILNKRKVSEVGRQSPLHTVQQLFKIS